MTTARNVGRLGIALFLCLGFCARKSWGGSAGAAESIFCDLSGTWHARYRHYDREDAGAGDIAYETDPWESRLELHGLVGAEDWRFITSGWIEEGRPSDIWQSGLDWPRDQSRRRRYVELNETYLRMYGKSCDFVVGKKVFRHGVAPLYSPADRYSRRDFTDPLEIRHLGRWLCHADWYVEDVTITTTVFPLHEPSKIPGADSRWAPILLPPGLAGSDDTSALLDSAQNEQSQTLKNTGGLLQARTRRGGCDLFVSAFHGLTYRSVIAPTTAAPGLRTDVVRATEGAAGITAAAGAWIFHAEGVYSHVHQGRDDSVVNYVGGCTYRLDPMPGDFKPERILIILEYAGEWIAQDLSDENVRGSKDYRFGRNDILGRMDVRMNDRFNLRLSGAVELDDGSWVAQVRGQYRFRETMVLTVTVDELGGSADGYYGRAGHNDSLAVACEYWF